MSYFKQLQLVDQYGFKSANTFNEEQRVIEPTRIIGASFSSDTIDENFWTHQTANGATVNASDVPGSVILNTGGSMNGSASFGSIRKARHISSVSLRYRTQSQLNNTGVVGNIRRWGMFNTDNGAYFKLDGTTFKACTCYMGNESTVATLTTPTVNLTSYEIYYGAGRVVFTINNVTVANLAASVTPWTSEMTLPINFENVNTGIDTVCTLATRVAFVTAMGKGQTTPKFYHFTGGAGTVILKRGAGTIHRVIINSSGGTSFGLYDNKVGDSSNSITTTDTIQPMSIEYMCPFNNGLTLTTVGNGVDVTIIYE